MYKLKSYFKNKEDWDRISNSIHVKRIDDEYSFIIRFEKKECKFIIRSDSGFILLHIKIKFTNKK
jgi:hypothetical protein